MKTLRFKIAGGEYKVLKDVSEIEISDEQAFNLIIKFTNGSTSVFTGDKKYILKRVAIDIDNLCVNTLTINKV
jgi:uncharacterized radical SAM superfamily Fe-S cluster-containing enzyme